MGPGRSKRTFIRVDVVMPLLVAGSLVAMAIIGIVILLVTRA